MAEVLYHVDSLYRLAFPDLAGQVLGRVREGGRDLALGQLDRALGDGFQVSVVSSRPVADQLDFGGIPVVDWVQGDEKSYLGTPIFQPIRFTGGTYQQLGTGTQAGQVIDAAYSEWLLPATTTAEFKRAKQLTRSKPSTANGSTKELWAFDDWDITIRGLLLDPKPNTFPRRELELLARWEKVADSLEVQGDMFTYLGIGRVVIESLHVGRVAGSPNVIPFQLQCVSDEPLEISLLSNQVTS